MKRVSLPLTTLLGLGTVGLSWWIHTRSHDFLASPSAAALEAAELRATRELARPADLFAVPRRASEPGEAVSPRTLRNVDAPEKPPHIEVGDLAEPPALDAWTERHEFPAASFIDLASRLETDTRFPEALVAWERVIDHVEADADERLAALNGIRRLREFLTSAGTPDTEPTDLVLAVETPADRIELTLRAAAEAAEILDRAAAGQISFESVVDPIEATPPVIRVSFRNAAGDVSALTETPAPETEDRLRRSILKAAFNSVSASLALEESLQPISLPEPGEEPADSLALRITRRAWNLFRKSLAET